MPLPRGPLNPRENRGNGGSLTFSHQPELAGSISRTWLSSRPSFTAGGCGEMTTNCTRRSTIARFQRSDWRRARGQPAFCWAVITMS